MSVLKLLPILDTEKGDENEVGASSTLFISMSVLKGNVVEGLPNILFMSMLLANVSIVIPKIGDFFGGAPIDAIPESKREPANPPKLLPSLLNGSFGSPPLKLLPKPLEKLPANLLKGLASSPPPEIAPVKPLIKLLPKLELPKPVWLTLLPK